jgi:acyl-CoA thioesterase
LSEPVATSRFERDTTVAPLGNGRWEAHYDEGWFATTGPNGGYLAAIVLKAMAAEIDDAARLPRSLNLHYLRPSGAGEAEIDVTVERAGRRLSTVTARVLQDDKLCLIATAAFSEAFETAADYTDPPPDVPPAGAVDIVPQERALVPVAKRFELRPALGAAPFSSADEALTGGWIDFAEGDQPIDPPALAMIADAWIPSPFVRLDRMVGAPTVDLTVHFRAPELVVTGPVLVVFRSRFAHAGFFEEDGEVWTADGRLLMQSRQLGLLSP